MISVIVPVYNCISSLERCVQSILTQTKSDLELLLIDDGSRDGSGLLCDRLAAQDARIRVYHKPNGGVSSARNLGLDHALGEYVMFCDSDDWVEPGWCEKLYEVICREPDKLTICNYFRNTPTSEAVNHVTAEEAIPKEAFWGLNRQELLGIPWNKIYIRQIIENHKIRFRSDISLGEDLIFVLDYLHYIPGGFSFVRIPLYHYVLGNSESLSVKYHANLTEIYGILYTRIRAELMHIPSAWEQWEQEYRISYFFAFDRIFRNTWSSRNTCSLLRKWRDNAVVFHSDEFQACRRTILNERINPLQRLGLKSNCFMIYWLTVAVSEWISNRRKRGLE